MLRRELRDAGWCLSEVGHRVAGVHLTLTPRLLLHAGLALELALLHLLAPLRLCHPLLLLLLLVGPLLRLG